MLICIYIYLSFLDGTAHIVVYVIPLPLNVVAFLLLSNVGDLFVNKCWLDLGDMNQSSLTVTNSAPKQPFRIHGTLVIFYIYSEWR